MPEPRALPLFRWGEELRRRRAGVRATRLKVTIAAAAGAVTAALSATVAGPPRPLLLWNASASLRPGLYRVAAPSQLRPGDVAVAWLPASAAALAAERDYLPRGVPLVKHVAATAGDRVCASSDEVSVNGIAVAVKRAADPRGRMLPAWTGCRILQGGELLLLGEPTPLSFDGRYFGVTNEDSLIGKARLLWAR